MEKDVFKTKLQEFIERNNIQVATSFDSAEQNVCLVTAVEDFETKNNDLWDLEANKSYPRDLNCAQCGRQIVMSGGMFSMYEKAEVKPVVACLKCVLDLK